VHHRGVFPVPGTAAKQDEAMLQQPLHGPVAALDLGQPRRTAASRFLFARRRQSGSASPAWARCSSFGQQGSCSSVAQGAAPPPGRCAAVAAALRWRRCHSWASPDRFRAFAVALAGRPGGGCHPLGGGPLQRQLQFPRIPGRPSGRRSARAQAIGWRRRGRQRLGQASANGPSQGRDWG